MNRALIQQWMNAADALGLDVLSPFELVLPGGETLRVPLLVRNFGAKNGMLVVGDYALVRSHQQEIADLGFGFSVLEASRPDADECQVRNGMIEMLSDWGWAGAPEQRPTWMKVL